jgi:hypothetical protein
MKQKEWRANRRNPHSPGYETSQIINANRGEEEEEDKRNVVSTQTEKKKKKKKKK